MKTSTFILLLVFGGLLCSSVATTHAQTTRMLVKPVELNVREHPFAKSRHIATIAQGEPLITSAKQGVWTYIVCGELRGWVTSVGLKPFAGSFTEEQEKRTGETYKCEWQPVSGVENYLPDLSEYEVKPKEERKPKKLPDSAVTQSADESVFTREYVGGPPSLYIKNDTNRIISFEFGGLAYKIPAYGDLSVSDFEAGAYRYVASAPGARALSGVD